MDSPWEIVSNPFHDPVTLALPGLHNVQNALAAGHGG